MSRNLPKVLFIAGTTAVGKTDLSTRLAELINGEIISADSVQVYRYMDIGSAKVDLPTRQLIRHHLLDVVGIQESFSIGDYHKLALEAIQDVISRGKVPIVVGGTSFYFQFLMSGLTESPPSTDASRDMIESLLAEDEGDWDKSLSRLEAIDPHYARTLGTNDWYRLKRALDICHQSGRTVTSFKQSSSAAELPYSCYCLFLTMPRVKLFHKIDERCEMMLTQGLLEEVVFLVRQCGLKPDSPAGRSIGYRQALEYLTTSWGLSSDDHVIKDVSVEMMRSQFIDFLLKYQSQTRQLARHQLTWFKKDPRFHWINMAVAPDGVSSLDSIAQHVMNWFQFDISLPPELHGDNLKILTPMEERQLHTYSADKVFKIYNCHENIDKTLEKLQKYLTQ